MMSSLPLGGVKESQGPRNRLGISANGGNREQRRAPLSRSPLARGPGLAAHSRARALADLTCQCSLGLFFLGLVSEGVLRSYAPPVEARFQLYA